MAVVCAKLIKLVYIFFRVWFRIDSIYIYFEYFHIQLLKIAKWKKNVDFFFQSTLLNSKIMILFLLQWCMCKRCIILRYFIEYYYGKWNPVDLNLNATKKIEMF